MDRLSGNKKSRAEFYFQQAKQYYAQGNYVVATRYFRRYLRIVPDNLDVYYALGGIYCHLRQFERAEGYCQQAIIALDPDYYSAHQKLGQIYMRLGRQEQGRLYTEKAGKIYNSKGLDQELKSILREC